MTTLDDLKAALAQITEERNEAVRQRAYDHGVYSHEARLARAERDAALATKPRDGFTVAAALSDPRWNRRTHSIRVDLPGAPLLWTHDGTGVPHYSMGGALIPESAQNIIGLLTQPATMVEAEARYVVREASEMVAGQACVAFGRAWSRRQVEGMLPRADALRFKAWDPLLAEHRPFAIVASVRDDKPENPAYEGYMRALKL